jgi:hypothetical protein
MARTGIRNILWSLAKIGWTAEPVKLLAAQS